MKERIKQLMEQQHMNQQAFAAATGISTATLSGIFNGRTNPTMKTVQDIKNKFPGISTDWLLFGTGGMFITSDEQGAQAAMSETASTVSGSSNMLFPEVGNDSFGGVNGSANMADSHASQPSLFDAPKQPSQSAARPSSVAGVKVVHQSASPSGHYGVQGASYQVPAAQSSRKITEIRVFYDDQTWESFVPKK